MILHFQKEINVIMYIIGLKKNQTISFGQNLNKIWIFKVYVFVMFKMKYLKIKCNVTYYHKWGGLMVGVFTFILKVKGPNLISDVCVINIGKLIEYSLI